MLMYLCTSENSVRQISGFVLLMFLVMLMLMSWVFSLVMLMLCLCTSENQPLVFKVLAFEVLVFIDLSPLANLLGYLLIFCRDFTLSSFFSCDLDSLITTTTNSLLVPHDIMYL